LVIEMPLGSFESLFGNSPDWSLVTVELGEAELELRWKVFDEARSLAIGESIEPVQGAASTTVPMAPNPGDSMNWPLLYRPVTITRISGGLQLKGRFEGTDDPKLTLSPCEDWCGSGNECSCFCDYDSAVVPDYRVSATLVQGWTE
jgi:hypothetical protein